MSTDTNRGRVPTILTLEARRAFDAAYILVLHRGRGAILVYDKRTGESITYTAFKKMHGTRGEQWLSLPKPMFGSWEHYRASCADVENGIRLATERALPSKNPYKRQEAE